MYKKTIKYTDYDGVEREEDFYFNLSKAEILEMQLSTEGGFQAKIEKIIASKDVPSLVAIFKDLLFKAYGEKSPDGKRFIKSKEISEAFSQTEAYSEFFMQLALDTDEATKFVNGIVPAELTSQLKEGMKNNAVLNNTGN